jgi:predicted DNA-binding antitoxin AbrB/MazE fold protein
LKNQASEGEVGVSGVGNNVMGERDCPGANSGYTVAVNVAIKAVYEEGKLRPLEPLKLAEHTVVQISFETDDAERREWLAQGERSLMKAWDNEADDVYNALLTK